MTKIVAKLFWSYDVEKTEKWFETMAARGYILEKVNTLTRRFTFKKQEPQQLVYRITFDKKTDGVLPTTLIDEGWDHAFSHRHWHFIAHEDAEKNINAFPSREGIINHNRTIMNIFIGILIYLIFTAMTSIMGLSIILFIGGPGEFVPSPYWVITVLMGIFTIGLWMITIYSIIKINKTNRLLIGETSIAHEESKSGTDHLIVKRRWYWFDAPDTLESWLEKMEQKGYNLVQISKRGFKFYFKKGAPRHVSYCVDFQSSPNKTYFDMHHETGWDLKFSSRSSLFIWSIWSQEYDSAESRPQIYSDHMNQSKHARKIMFTNLLLSIPFLFLIYIMITMDDFFNLQMSMFRWTILIIYILGIIMFGIRIVRTILYYLRVRSTNYS